MSAGNTARLQHHNTTPPFTLGTLMSDFLKGARYLLLGLKLLNTPGLRRYVAIPLTINAMLFSLLIYFLTTSLSSSLDTLLNTLPDWLSFLYWVVMPAFVFILLFISGYVFNIFANFIAAPFNGLLAEKVELQLTGQSIEGDSSLSGLLRIVPHSLGRELAKLKYYLPRVLALIVLTVLPVLSIASPFAWAAWGAWMMTIQYMDYPMDNHQTNFTELKQTVAQQRLTSLGFGSSIVVAVSIPVVNFLVMPAAVAGATLMWVEEYQQSFTSRSEVK